MPVTEDIICTGNNIPDIVYDEDQDEAENDGDVYYKMDDKDKMRQQKKTPSLRDFHNLVIKKRLILSVCKPGDTLIDFACGKAGDLSKWIEADLSFVFGIDISKDNLENRINGACVRFLKNKQEYKRMPDALFVNGNSGLNIRNGNAMMNDKAKQITKAVFGQGPKNDDIGKAVLRQYGKGEHGFNVSSCQFAIHYFLKDADTFFNFIGNVSECTKVGGYFIGTCYDGHKIFDLLKKTPSGDSISYYDKDDKILEIRKDYNTDVFDDDITSIGYQISVNQISKCSEIKVRLFIHAKQLINWTRCGIIQSSMSCIHSIPKQLSSSTPLTIGSQSCEIQVSTH